MKLMDKLFNGKGYIDGITIINLKGEILFTAKFNNKLSHAPTIEHEYEVVGKKFLEVYENLDEETSTTYQAMVLGIPIYKENQLLKSKNREAIRITSLSIPIKSGNVIVGAIDLSVNSETEEDLKETLMEVEDLQIGDLDLLGMNADTFKGNRVDTLAGSDRQSRYSVDHIITNDREMMKIKQYVTVAAGCDLPTLIYGETGTGKELFAHAIHDASNRRNKPFITQNCAAIPENLLESILFGTSRGAFTGAVDNIGLLEMADGGTILLDEINSMPLHLQSKLLRVLEDGTIRSVGSEKEFTVDVKVIAAMNEDPLKAIASGFLRRDIYYRLSALNITIPPLRERKEDIPLLVNFMVLKYNQILGKNIKYIAQETLDELNSYEWPGNIRELENVIIHGMSLVDNSQETLGHIDISDKLSELEAYDQELDEGTVVIKPLAEMVHDFERRTINQALKKVDFNVTKASKILKTPRQTLQRKVKRYGL